MKYYHLKKDLGALHLSVISFNFQNYEIPTNVIDKNTKFTTESVYIVTCGSFEIYIYLYVKVICLRYAHILFNVSKMFRANSILGFCFT